MFRRLAFQAGHAGEGAQRARGGEHPGNLAPLVLGVVVFYAALIIALNLVVDILYGVIDPRVRYR